MSLNELSWEIISKTPELGEEFIIKNTKNINWDLISQYQKLSEEFIGNNSNKVNWRNISIYQKLSEKFIIKNYDKVYWLFILMFQKLSEKFIRQNFDKMSTDCLSAYQKLSEEFIREYSDKLYLYNIVRFQKLSPEFIKKYNLIIPETNWLYKDKEFKREYIKENTNYEIIGDKVIAYKSCRADGYSVFNFQYHYEVGGEYECHADYNIDTENSFGLSAWTKEGSLLYYSDGILFKVEIDLEDIAAIVHIGNKIRASRIKILEEISI